MIESEIISGLIGKGTDFFSDAIKELVNRKMFYKNMRNVILKSVKSAMKDCNKKWNVWDNHRFMKYISKQDIYELPMLRDNSIRQIMHGYFKAYKINEIKITEMWLKSYNKKHDLLCSQSPVLSHYYLLCAIREEKMKEEYAAEETYDLINCLKQDIDLNRKTNMYNGVDIVNRTLYPFLLRRLTKGCSNNLLELGYGLTDIYDHVSQYDKSVELVSLILKIEKNANKPISMRHLQILIGCTYSLVIAKENDIKKKEKTLYDAQKTFMSIEAEINKWLCMDKVDNAEKLFIKGLYESNIGALHTNLADLAVKTGNEKEQKQELEIALAHHLLGEKARKKLVHMVELGLNSELSFDAKKRLYQSKSNIAGLYYRFGEYEKALELHEEVLQYRKKAEAESDVMLTKTYIAGCYLEKHKNVPIKDQECNMFYTYTEECRKYYKDNGDKDRLNIIIKMIGDFNNLND